VIRLKRQLRAVGVDDAPFTQRKGGSTYVVITLVRAPNYLEGVYKIKVSIDGMDATEKIIEGLKTSRFCSQMRVFMIEGACVAGFNPVDIEEIYNEFKVLSMSVTKNKPHPKRIESALRKHFKDWRKRLEIINKGRSVEFSRGNSRLYVRYYPPEKYSPDDVLSIVTMFTVRGIRPEPIRLADLIASLL